MPLERLDRKPAGGQAAGCVVVLHGRGVTGEDLVPLAGELRLPNLRFIFPDAPFSFPGFDHGWCWYESTPDHDGLTNSRRLLFDLLRGLEQEGVAPGQTVLLGFSQGAVMALDVGVRYPKRLGGIIALSGYLCAPEALREEKSPAAAGLPILMAHGSEDDVLPVQWARTATNALKAEGFQVKFLEYPMGHQIVMEEVEEVRAFLRAILPCAD